MAKKVRPDYIKCIRHTDAEKVSQSWCGRHLEAFEWSFTNIDHAIYNGTKGSNLACPECLKAIKKALDELG